MSDEPGTSTSSKRKIDSDKRCQPAFEEGFHFVKVKQLGEEYNKNAFSFHEIISAISPSKSAHFNFCLDLEFVFKSYPAHLRKRPMLFVTGDESHKEALPHLKPISPDIQIATAKLQNRFGHHHTKLSLFVTEQGLHVIVSTANLIPFDWENLSQGFYYAFGEFLKDDTGLKRVKKQDLFGDDLQNYIRTAYLNPSLGRVNEVQFWSDLFSTQVPDFSHIKDRLIYSIPGKQWLKPMGNQMLRSILGKKYSPGALDDCTFVAQVSSIGTLGQNEDEWLMKEFCPSFAGKNSVKKDFKFNLVYPSMKTMAESVDGWESGGAFPWSQQVYCRELWLGKYLCDWKSDQLGRSRCMPHIKSYAAIKPDGTTLWLLITSANLSKAAWGRKNHDGASSVILSYELGVLMHSSDHDHLKLPYDWPLTKYGNSDTPFRRQTHISLNDCLGREYPFTT